MDKSSMTTDEVARQLRQPTGEGGVFIGTQMNKSNKLMYEMTIPFLRLQEGDAVLEIGPGNGYFIPLLFEQEPGIRYTGVDLSETMVAEAVLNNAARIHSGLVTIYHTSAAAMPVDTASVNKVFGVNVLYFWDQPDIPLQEIHRILKAGGELVLAIRSKATMELLPFVHHGFTLYDITTAEKLLQQNGFQVTEVTTAREPEKQAADGSQLVQLENICLRAIKI